MSEENKGMFDGITAKDWIIGFFTGFLWIFYKIHKNGAPFGKIIGGFVGVIVIIGILGAIFGEKKPSSTNETVTTTEVKIDNSIAEKAKVEEEAKKKAESEKLAKEKAEEEAKKKAEAKRLENIAKYKEKQKAIKAVKYESSFITNGGSKSTYSSITHKTTYNIKINNGELIIHSKRSGMGEFDFEKIEKVLIERIADIVIWQSDEKGKKERGMTPLYDIYSMELMFGEKSSLTVEDITNETKYKQSYIYIISNSLTELNKLASLLNKKVNSSIHKSENFTINAKTIKTPIICKSKKSLGKALILEKISTERFKKELKEGQCTTNNRNMVEAMIEKEFKEDEFILLKFKEKKSSHYQYKWIAKKELQ